MEELEYKLKTDNTILIANSISKLVDNIKQNRRGDDKVSLLDDGSELRFLQEQCQSSVPIVSITACQGLMSLVEDGILEVSKTLTSLISMLSTAQYYTSIISAVGKLLTMDLKSRLKGADGASYQTPFTLRTPQHPFITILLHKQNVWFDVLNQMQCICNHHDESISQHSIVLFRPVFLYVLCNPGSTLDDHCKLEAWRLLVKHKNRAAARPVILEVLCWIKTCTPRSCLLACSLCIELIDNAMLMGDVEMYIKLCPYLMALVHSLVRYGFDPRQYFTTVRTVVDMANANNYEFPASIVIMLLTDTVNICPAVYLEDLMILCNEIILKNNISRLSVYVLKSSFLQWMACPSYLSLSALSIANQIFKHSEDAKGMKTKQSGNKIFRPIETSDLRLEIYIKLSHIAEELQSDSDDQIVNWLVKLKLTNNLEFVYDIRNFLYGIFISDMKTEVMLKVLDVLLCCARKFNQLSVGFLPLILYKLARETEPKALLELLRAIPEMAVVKENMSLVIHTLESLWQGPSSLRTLCVDLQLRLWRVEVRSYPYLQAILVAEPRKQDNVWEVNIAKATAIKAICETRPEHHGTELVAHLSQLLNRSGDSTGSLVSAISIEAIACLCRAGVVDVVSTWKALAPRLSKDKRPPVIVSLCKMFGDVPTLHCPTMDYEKLISELVERLWLYVSSSDDKTVIVAALQALGHYSIDQMNLKQLPDVYRQDLKLPAAYSKTPVDAARKPEDVLPYIPGECWVQLLKNVNHCALDEAGGLVSTWIEAEISQYRSGIYIVTDNKGEPNNYSTLPHKSVVKAITEFVIGQATKKSFDCHESTLLQCLRVLGVTYSRPLPPINWSFLHDLFHFGPKEQILCIVIAIKQLFISGTAKRFIENYLSTFNPSADNTDEILNIFSNLKDLCKGIQPNLLRPVIEKSLSLALDNALTQSSPSEGKDCKLLFTELISRIRDTLRLSDIHDANRTLLAQLVERLIDRINVNDEVFLIYASCCMEFPVLHLDRISAPSTWWEVTPDKLQKATVIRCALAKATEPGTSDTPLVWLNEIIDGACSIPSEQSFVLKQILPVFESPHVLATSSMWCLELMGQIQATIFESGKEDTCVGSQSISKMQFLCDVLLLAVSALSACHCLGLRPNSLAISPTVRINVFPAALYSLCHQQDEWKACSGQVLEWLFHMAHSPAVTETFALCFHHALVLLKDSPHFEKPNVWMRFVNAQIVPNCR